MERNEKVEQNKEKIEWMHKSEEKEQGQRMEERHEGKQWGTEIQG